MKLQRGDSLSAAIGSAAVVWGTDVLRGTACSWAASGATGGVPVDDCIMEKALSNPSGHQDRFVIENLPATDQQPEYRFEFLERPLPSRFNAAHRLVDYWVEAGQGDRIAIRQEHESWTYAQLLATSNRIAGALTACKNFVSGTRVLLQGPNSAMMVACWLGIVKAGGVAVTVMPLLRARDLRPVIAKAKIAIALCDDRLKGEVEAAGNGLLATIWSYNATGDAVLDGEFEHRLAGQSSAFRNADVSADDPVLLGFTSGTTGDPKATIHFHRDIALMNASYVDGVLKPSQNDVFIGSPPIGFTFGLGALVLFPLYAGASVVLIESGSPDRLGAAIERHRATICFTAPTAYRAMMELPVPPNLSSLRLCISAGEHLPLSVLERWQETVGVPLLNLIGSTEMFHAFICMRPDAIRPGAIGKPCPGFVSCILDDDGNAVPTGKPGRLAVKGPTGCRYLHDGRQKTYVMRGWNITGDICFEDAEGYFWYMSRGDDMIISSGYNISGVDVEAVLAEHPSVKEVAVVGTPDPERGQIVTAFVVLRDGAVPGDQLVKELQAFVKANIAPYKYPRAIRFLPSLPKTATGKTQRRALLEAVTEE